MRRAIVFALAVLIPLGVSTFSSYAGSGDEPHYLAIAHSLAFDRDLDMSNNYGANEPLIADGGLAPDEHAIAGRGGVLRPVHDIGMPLLMSPLIAVVAPASAFIAAHVPAGTLARAKLTPSGLYRHLLQIILVLIGGLIAVWLYESLQRLGAPERLSFWSALLLAASPPLVIYSLLFFSEMVSAALALIAFTAIVLDGRPSPSRWLVAGAAVGLLPLVHIRNVGLAAALLVIGVIEVVRLRDRRSLALFLAPALALFAVRTGVNAYLWGALVTNPHVRTGNVAGAADLFRISAKRLAGLFVDQESGLLPYAPIVVVAILGVIRLSPRVRTPLLVTIAAYLLMVIFPLTNAHGWTGGWSPAARFMVPIVPLLGLGLAEGIRATPRPIVATVIAMQLLLNVYFWTHPKNLWNDGDGRAAVCQRGGFRGCQYLPSISNE